MREAYGNLWDFHERGHWICITTNGFVKANREAVMGKGTAEQAKHRFPALPGVLGRRIKTLGNHVQMLPNYRIAAFPVKHHWRDKADLELIIRSATELQRRIEDPRFRVGKTIYLPRPGCGNGGLDWHDVRDAIYELLTDRVVVITNGPRS